MTHAPDRSFSRRAIWLAAALHALLFAAVRPKGPGAVRGVPVAPATNYLTRGAPGAVSSEEVRTTLSPVLFALPSRMGFSQRSLDTQVRTPRIRLHPEAPERFLEVSTPRPAPAPRGLAELSLTAAGPAAPPVPFDVYQEPSARPAARRVMFSPALRARVDGAITLPPELNKAVEKPWEAIASIRVSEEGVVRNVMLDQPIEPPELNQHVLQLLYALRFKPGPAIEGAVEVYSPEAAAPSTEAAP